MARNDTSSLYELGDRGQTVDGSANDIRGLQVKDKNGEGIGKVTELLVDDRDREVRFLLVEHGGLLGFNETNTLIPVDAVVKVTENGVFVDQSRDRIASAPGYAPDLIEDRPYQSSIYNHYGFGPYWDEAYAYLGSNLGMQETRQRSD